MALRFLGDPKMFQLGGERLVIEGDCLFPGCAVSVNTLDLITRAASCSHVGDEAGADPVP